MSIFYADVARIATAEFGTRLFAVSLAVLASRPAARPALTFFQLLLGPADAPCSGRLLLGVLDPADELVSRQRRDVLPRIERGRIADECGAQVDGKLVDHASRHSRAAHSVTVPAVRRAVRGTSCIGGATR